MPRTIATIAVAVLLLPVRADCGDKKPLTFQDVMMGEIQDKEATEAGFRTRGWSYAHFGFTSFNASNGHRLTVCYDDFSEAAEAKRFLDWKKGKAYKVLTQSTRTDAEGKPTEYRMESIPDSNRSDVEVMWVVGTNVHWIDASTREDALELERQYRH